MGCECNLPQSKKDALRYKQIASQLPLLRGSIIRPDGTVIDICDVVGIPKSPIDPQLAKAQNIYPYIRDTVILEDGQMCSLSELIDKFLYEFERVQGIEDRWMSYINELHTLLNQMEEYVKWVEEQAGLVYTDELRLDYYAPLESDWIVS